MCLESGRRKAPRDSRFPLELGGIAFKQQQPGRAKRHLFEALRLAPGDRYAADFLATIYFVENNLDAALKYWNHAGKPRIEAIRARPEPGLDPVLLDRAFAFSPVDVLRLEDLETTRARLNLLDVFARCDFELAALEDESFELRFRSLERGNLAENKAAALVSLLRGLPYQTVHPEFFNLGGEARNFRSLVRWDAQKRRAWAAFSAPLNRDPKWRYGLYLDGRKEAWIGDFRLQKLEAGAEIRSVVNGRWGWASGLVLSHRVLTARPRPEPLFADGVLLRYQAELNRRVLRIPERRLTVDSSATVQFGRLFADGYGPFSRAQGSLAWRWFPRARGDSVAASWRLRGGKTWGPAPFDELFQLGIERDNDLWLRGHAGTREGRKGSAPLGRSYLLSNWELETAVYENAFFQVKLGPFLDTGRAYGFNSREWLWDAGLQLKLRALGVEVIFSWGKDLRSGRNTFYLTTSR